MTFKWEGMGLDIGVDAEGLKGDVAKLWSDLGVVAFWGGEDTVAVWEGE